MASTSETDGTSKTTHCQHAFTRGGRLGVLCGKNLLPNEETYCKEHATAVHHEVKQCLGHKIVNHQKVRCEKLTVSRYQRCSAHQLKKEYKELVALAEEEQKKRDDEEAQKILSTIPEMKSGSIISVIFNGLDLGTIEVNKETTKYILSKVKH